MTEWISAEDKDKLPEDDMVWLYAPGTPVGEQIHIGYWDRNEEMWISQGGKCESTKRWFTHWMPLEIPEPPKQDGVTVNISINGYDIRMTDDEFAERVENAIRRAICRT